MWIYCPPMFHNSVCRLSSGVFCDACILKMDVMVMAIIESNDVLFKDYIWYIQDL